MFQCYPTIEMVEHAVLNTQYQLQVATIVRCNSRSISDNGKFQRTGKTLSPIHAAITEVNQGWRQTR
jgi:hypothetical protein